MKPYKLIIWILLILFLYNSNGSSQNIPNGYYNSDKSQWFIYCHNDTVIFPFSWGTKGITIYKGIFDGKKWINFIPVKNKIESSYKIVQKDKSDSISVLRFNMYDLNGKMFSQDFDGTRPYDMWFNAALRCRLAYVTPDNISINRDTTLLFNGQFIEMKLSNNRFTSASLTIQGRGEYVTVPIIKDSLVTVDVFQAPPISYKDKQKRMQYVYSAKKQTVKIRFNFPFYKEWHSFIKTDNPYVIRGSCQEAVKEYFPTLEK